VTTDAPTLFDDPRPGGVHRTDGLGPRLAAADTTNQIRWGSHRARLLNVYSHCHAPEGLTDDKAGMFAGLDHVQATRRISELLRDGLLYFTGQYGLSETQSTARMLAITPAGREALAGSKGRP